MSYKPTTWKSGDTITSQKLNKIEQGIVSAESIEPLVINIIYDETLEYHRLDKTFGEIYFFKLFALLIIWKKFKTLLQY